MNRLTKLLVATAAGAALSFAAAASQAAVFISFDTGSGPVQVFTQADGAIFYGNFSGAGGFESITITGDSAALPGLLHTQNAEVNNEGGGPASIKIYVTHTDITGGLPSFGYLSSFTGNSNRAGFTVNLETRVDAGNGAGTGFLGGTLLSSASYNGSGATSNNNVFAGALAPSAGPYSVTHVYEISDIGGDRGSSSPSITLQAAVPEPATWGLMILGFGSAGAMIRSRRRQAVAA